jgi:hypothetical protein
MISYEDLYSYYKTLRNFVRYVLPIYLKVDKDNKPAFSYPDLNAFSEDN